MRLTSLLGLVLPALGLLCPAAGAASFDCAKASEAHEKLICADQALSGKDEEMARLYKGAQAVLSEEGKRLLTAGQRSWLLFIRKLCPVPAAPAQPEAQDAARACIDGQYDGRIAALKRAVVTKGPFRFMRVESFEARKGSPDDDSANHPGIDELQRAYPRIDAPDDPETRRWNEHVAAFAKKLAGATKEADKAGEEEEDDSDSWLDYEIVFASPALISVEFTLSTYGHGAAHPNSASAAFNAVPAKAEPIKAADLFDGKSAWQDFLAKRCFDDLKRRDLLGEPPAFPSNAEGIKAMAADAERWLIDAKGVRVEFNTYEVAPYAAGPQEVAIPWAELKPYLAAHPPFPIPPG